MTGVPDAGGRSAAVPAPLRMLGALGGATRDRLAEVADPALRSARLLEGRARAEAERRTHDAAIAAVAWAIDSGLVDEVVERLLASDALWRLVDEIAQSAAVTEAIARQGVGFADEVAGGVRVRSRRADALLERAARRALRRRPAEGPAAPAAP